MSCLLMGKLNRRNYYKLCILNEREQLPYALTCWQIVTEWKEYPNIDVSDAYNCQDTFDQFECIAVTLVGSYRQFYFNVQMKLLA